MKGVGELFVVFTQMIYERLGIALVLIILSILSLSEAIMSLFIQLSENVIRSLHYGLTKLFESDLIALTHYGELLPAVLMIIASIVSSKKRLERSFSQSEKLKARTPDLSYNKLYKLSVKMSNIHYYRKLGLFTLFGVVFYICGYQYSKVFMVIALPCIYKAVNLLFYQRGRVLEFLCALHRYKEFPELFVREKGMSATARGRLDEAIQELEKAS